MSTNFHPEGAASGAFLSNVKTVTWGQLRDHQFPSRRFVIEPLLHDRQVGMIYAPTGVGKTWLTLSLGVVAASGNGANFLGFRNDGDGMRVLLIDGEMDAEDLQQRLKLIVKAVGAHEDTVRDNLSIASRQHQELSNRFPDIADERWQDEILRYCAAKDIRLLVLDNLSTLAPSLDDENSASSMIGINTMLLKAKQAGVACIVVHHANKTGKSYRGSSAMTVTLDIVMVLKRPEEYSPIEGETAFTIEFEKVRGQVPSEVTAPRTVVFKTSDGAPRWEEDESPATQSAHLKQLLESLKFTSQKELADHQRVSAPTMSRRINEAIAAEVFTKDDMQVWFGRAKELQKARKEADGGAQSVATDDNGDGETTTTQHHDESLSERALGVAMGDLSSGPTNLSHSGEAIADRPSATTADATPTTTSEEDTTEEPTTAATTEERTIGMVAWEDIIKVLPPSVTSRTPVEPEVMDATMF